MGWELHAIATFAGHRSTDSTLQLHPPVRPGPGGQAEPRHGAYPRLAGGRCSPSLAADGGPAVSAAPLRGRARRAGAFRRPWRVRPGSATTGGRCADRAPRRRRCAALGPSLRRAVRRGRERDDAAWRGGRTAGRAAATMPGRRCTHSDCRVTRLAGRGRGWCWSAALSWAGRYWGWTARNGRARRRRRRASGRRCTVARVQPPCAPFVARAAPTCWAASRVPPARQLRPAVPGLAGVRPDAVDGELGRGRCGTRRVGLSRPRRRPATAARCVQPDSPAQPQPAAGGSDHQAFGAAARGTPRC